MPIFITVQIKLIFLAPAIHVALKLEKTLDVSEAVDIRLLPRQFLGAQGVA
jgi:hypothetical protein